MNLYYILLINATVSLVMGTALVMVWRRDHNQRFTLYLGSANLVQLLVPTLYGLTTYKHPAIALFAKLSLPFVAASYTTLLAAGAGHLSSRPIKNKSLWIVLLVLAAINGTTLGIGGLALGQVAIATANTLLGAVCIYWLRNTTTPRGPTESLVGPLLLLLGLIQFIFVFYQADGAALLATLGAILRMALGLALLYAALDRGMIAARKLQHRFERLSERSHQGILISIYSRSSKTNRIVYANPACLSIYGVADITGLTEASVANSIPKTEQRDIARVIANIQTGKKDDATYEALRHRRDGTPLWLRFHYFRTEWDGVPAVQVLISDETEQYKANQALAHQALHDELTGLPNRAALIQNLRNRCHDSQAGEPFVLILLDIDRFKLFNEAHGHSMGDEVLKVFGQTMRSAVDMGHDVLRLGEDEFAIISAPGSKGDTAVELARCVRQMLSKPLPVSGGVFFLDASLGIALYPNSAQDAESLLRAANAAMHVAKLTPGTSYKLAEKRFERGSSNALEQEQALRAGIESSEFHLVYQPKVNAQSGALTSFEALARWNRPVVGPVSPLEFIAAAERTGLIGALGTALLKQACEQIAVWQERYSTCVPVAVNVSPLQLLDPRFPQLVAQMLDTHRIQPQWLTLEITESSAVQNMEQTVSQVEQLRTMGVHVAMDDFGTGFSSLNMLRTLRLHTVKIDRGLIDPLPSADSVAVVRAICQLAEALHLHVVAEGVETIEQADAARDAGCHDLQGYLYSRPLSAVDAGLWLDYACAAVPAQ
jgi:diguanylate cyclase (GGDEF)-like protein/PAS domain S-box-containing protein